MEESPQPLQKNSSYIDFSYIPASTTEVFLRESVK